MNKQEVISKLESAIPKNNIDDYQKGETAGLNFALLLLAELDEPRKPVVPQFVADWIEWCKKNKITFLGADTAICNNKNIRSLDASGWAWKNQETFAKAWLFDYEVEKEKLYTVEIPTHGNPNHFVLRKHLDGRVCLDCYRSDNWRDYEFSQLTEAEIKREHGWAWQFAKEVEE